MRGWRKTAEIVLFEISNSMKPYLFAVHVYTSKLRPVVGSFEPKKLDEASDRIPPTSHLRLPPRPGSSHGILGRFLHHRNKPHRPSSDRWAELMGSLSRGLSRHAAVAVRFVTTLLYYYDNYNHITMIIKRGPPRGTSPPPRPGRRSSRRCL